MENITAKEIVKEEAKLAIKCLAMFNGTRVDTVAKAIARVLKDYVGEE